LQQVNFLKGCYSDLDTKLLLHTKWCLSTFKIGGTGPRLERLRIEARRAESGGWVLGEWQRAPSPLARGSGGAL